MYVLCVRDNSVNRANMQSVRSVVKFKYTKVFIDARYIG